MIEINIYKTILIIHISEQDLDLFYHSLKSKKSYFISNNGYKIIFTYCKESRILIKEKSIFIYINPAKFDIVLNLILQHLESNQNFPLDISLEQLGFFIESNEIEIEDVVFESGSYNDNTR